MEPRLIFQIRISKRWTRGSQDPARSLAQYIYSFYTFLGLADPSATWGWTIGNDSDTGVPYLFLWENPISRLGGEDSDSEEGLGSADLDSDFESENGDGEDPLGEEDLNPDL